MSDVKTREEAAAYLRISPQTLDRLAKNKQISRSKVGSQWRYRVVDLEDYLSKTRTVAQDANAVAV